MIKINHITALLESLWLCEDSLTQSAITRHRKEEADKLNLLPNCVDAASADSDSGERWLQQSFEGNTLMNNIKKKNFKQLFYSHR